MEIECNTEEYLINIGSKIKENVSRSYSWPFIIDEYEKLFVESL